MPAATRPCFSEIRTGIEIVANNYLQFSECLDVPSDEAAAWIESQLDTSGLCQDLPPQYGWVRDKFDLEDRANGFDWQIEADKEGQWQLWLHADEDGSPASVARFVQAYLRKFWPDRVWTLTYALTCSKPRVGEF